MTTIMRFARATEVITAEYHPDDDGMPYVLHIEGGRHTGTVIHAATESSVIRLFNDVVRARKSNTEHPYLIPV